MTITLRDADTLYCRVGRVPTDVVLDLAAMLSGTSVRLSIGPDEQEAPQAQPSDPGFFGLCVALAYDTWGRPAAQDEEYLAYLHGEQPDPRD